MRESKDLRLLSSLLLLAFFLSFCSATEESAVTPYRMPEGFLCRTPTPGAPPPGALLRCPRKSPHQILRTLPDNRLVHKDRHLPIYQRPNINIRLSQPRLQVSRPSLRYLNDRNIAPIRHWPDLESTRTLQPCEQPISRRPSRKKPLLKSRQCRQRRQRRLPSVIDQPAIGMAQFSHLRHRGLVPRQHRTKRRTQILVQRHIHRIEQRAVLPQIETFRPRQ